MRTLFPHVLLALGLAVLAGCDAAPSSSSDTGTARFAVSAPQSLSAEISRVSVTASAEDIPAVTLELVRRQGAWSGVIGNIPAGEERTFHAQAFDSTGALRFQGAATGVSISPAQDALVAITLQQVEAPPVFVNSAPVIHWLVSSSTSVLPGGSLVLRTSTYDDKSLVGLSYSWSATDGTFSTKEDTTTQWTAPETTGLQTVTFKVSDSEGLSSDISIVINVSSVQGEGEAQLFVTFNSTPRVDDVTAGNTPLAVGEARAVSVSAVDPDGDPLYYSWSATCEGYWSDTGSSSTEFIPTAQPGGACNNCELSVTVSDGNGAQNTGTVSLCVGGSAATPHLSPVIVRSYRSSDTAGRNQQLTYEVMASDPEGSALSFSWSATVGYVGVQGGDEFTSRAFWRAPSCIYEGTTPTVTVTVTNAFNMTATKSFVVTPLRICPSTGWLPTGDLASPSKLPTATLLPNGKVLVVNGDTSNSLSEDQLYEPTTHTWSTTGSIVSRRAGHTATLLSNGKVLLVGGTNYWGEALATAQLYEPATGSANFTGAMASRRIHHTATVLSNGKVLVVGGRGLSGSALPTAELYDPATGTWSATGSLSSPRFRHTAVLLPSGKVLVVGGSSSNSVHLASAELYDPATGTWSTTGSLSSPRFRHAMALLPGGKVLLVGGVSNYSPMTMAELYDPATGTWRATSAMAAPRSYHTATLLRNGKVLVAGGNSTYGATATAELYDPAAGTWSSAGTMESTREQHTATLLPNGKVLIAGGLDSYGQYLSRVELYAP